MQQTSNPVLDADDRVALCLQRIDPESPEVLLVRLNPNGWSSVTRQEIETMIRELGKAN